MNLKQREIEVIKTIVQTYIEQGVPVGSRYVAKHSRLKLSPASIRNIMADLTDKGYLEQPYTSAGRMPTAKAFRFYVDDVLNVSPLSDVEKKNIVNYLGSAGLELPEILKQASKLISSLSHQVSMVLAPQQNLARWHRIDFIPIRTGLVMTILVVQGGVVRNKLVTVDEHVTQDDLIKYSNYLNDRFEGKTLQEVRTEIVQEMHNAQQEFNALYQKALDLAHAAFEQKNNKREIFVEGTVHMFDQLANTDVSSMRDLLKFLEERSELLQILDKVSEEEGPTVTLGNELPHEDLVDWSMICSSYSGESENLGVVGIIGPIRMNYAKVVPVVDFTARILTEMFKTRF